MSFSLTIKRGEGEPLHSAGFTQGFWCFSWIPSTWWFYTLLLVIMTLYLAYCCSRAMMLTCVEEQSRSSAESLMLLHIMADLVAFFHSGDIYHFCENCQVCDERGIILPLTVTPWLIQARLSACRCVFILVQVVNINNAHRGPSSDSLGKV